MEDKLKIDKIDWTTLLIEMKCNTHEAIVKNDSISKQRFGRFQFELKCQAPFV